MASEAGEHLAIAKAKIAVGPLKADVATAWAAIGILQFLVENSAADALVERMMQGAKVEVFDQRLGEGPADPTRRAAALEKQLWTTIRQRDDALTQIVALEDERDHAIRARDIEGRHSMRLGAKWQELQRERDEARKDLEGAQQWIRMLEGQLKKSMDEAGEAVGVASERLAELELQVANQADMIRRQREELQRLRAGAEA